MSTDRSLIVRDLRELADLLSAHSLHLAYENWCWSTHAPTWRDVYSLILEVDRPNIGLCLDTFQTAGYEYGDPTTASGLVGGAGGKEGEGVDGKEEEGREKGVKELETRYRRSLEQLVREVPREKIYILQISDAYRVHLPDKLDAEGKRPRVQWSSSLRPLPYEGGYLPIVPMARAVWETGFRGWWSMEVFDGGSSGTAMKREDWEGKKGEDYARRAMASLRRFVGEVGGRC